MRERHMAILRAVALGTPLPQGVTELDVRAALASATPQDERIAIGRARPGDTLRTT